MSNFDSWDSIQVRPDASEDRVRKYKLNRQWIYTVGDSNGATLTFIDEPDTTYPCDLFCKPDEVTLFDRKTSSSKKNNGGKEQEEGDDPVDFQEYQAPNLDDYLFPKMPSSPPKKEDKEPEEDMPEEDMPEEHGYEETEEEDDHQIMSDLDEFIKQLDVSEEEDSAEEKPSNSKKSSKKRSPKANPSNPKSYDSEDNDPLNPQPNQGGIPQPEEEEEEVDDSFNYSKMLDQFTEEDFPEIKKMSGFRLLLFDTAQDLIPPGVTNVYFLKDEKEKQLGSGEVVINNVVHHVRDNDRIIYLPYTDIPVGILGPADPSVDAFDRDAMLHALMYSHYKTARKNFSLISVFREYMLNFLGGNYMENHMFVQEIMFNINNRKFNENMKKYEQL